MFRNPSVDIIITDGIYEGKCYLYYGVNFLKKSLWKFSLISCILIPFHIHVGITIGGDIFPGSTLPDHVLRFNNIP